VWKRQSEEEKEEREDPETEGRRTINQFKPISHWRNQSKAQAPDSQDGVAIVPITGREGSLDLSSSITVKKRQVRDLAQGITFVMCVGWSITGETCIAKPVKRLSQQDLRGDMCPHKQPPYQAVTLTAAPVVAAVPAAAKAQTPENIQTTWTAIKICIFELRPWQGPTV
jgi:hypothetical protein